MAKGGSFLEEKKIWRKYKSAKIGKLAPKLIGQRNAREEERGIDDWGTGPESPFRVNLYEIQKLTLKPEVKISN